jgi:aminoglycoside phosphotransferase (APT) family kinase protein
VTLDPAGLGAYLSTRLGRTTVTGVRQSYPGNSRQTWLVGTVEHGGLVVRVDHPGGPLVPIPLLVEYQVYERLWPTEVPVAEPLFYAEGTELADGRAHMVRRLVEGSAQVPGLTGGPGDDPALRRAVAYEVAEKLALVHTLDWAAAGLDEVVFTPSSGQTALREELREWRRLWAATRTDPFPMLTEATYWLEEQIPAVPARRCLLKGNNGIGEEIWRDGRIVALSDWELAAIGDPSLDWAFSQGVLALHDLDDTLAHYATHAGDAVDRALLAWAAVWIRIKASMTTNGGLAGFLGGRDRRLVRPALGISIVKRTEAWIAGVLDRPVVDVGEQLLTAYRSSYLDGAHR